MRQEPTTSSYIYEAVVVLVAPKRGIDKIIQELGPRIIIHLCAEPREHNMWAERIDMEVATRIKTEKRGKTFPRPAGDRKDGAKKVLEI